MYILVKSSVALGNLKFAAIHDRADVTLTELKEATG